MKRRLVEWLDNLSFDWKTALFCWPLAIIGIVLFVWSIIKGAK